MRLPPKLWRLLRSRRLKRFAIWTPIVLMTVLAVYYGGMNARGDQAYRKWIKTLPGRGIETKAEVYFGDDLADAENAFEGKAMAALLNASPSNHSGWQNLKLPFTTNRDLGEVLDLTRKVSPHAKGRLSDQEIGERLLNAYPDIEADWPEVKDHLLRRDLIREGRSMNERYWSIARTDNIEGYAGVHAMAGVLMRQSDGALEDLQALVNFERLSFRARPTILSFIIGRFAQREFSNVVWEGVKRGLWDDAALQRLSRMLEDLDPRRDAVAAVRGEIVDQCTQVAQREGLWSRHLSPLDVHWRPGDTGHSGTLQYYLWEYWLSMRPSGSGLLDAAQSGEEMIGNGIEDHGVPRERFGRADLIRFREKSRTSLKNWIYVKKEAESVISCCSAWKDLEILVNSSLGAETDLNLTRAGIALERYRLKNGSYPETLSALVPEFLPGVPSDPFADQPLHYRRQPDGTPLVWSVGSNLIDDGGLPRSDSELGDWVWLIQPVAGYERWKYSNNFWR